MEMEKTIIVDQYQNYRTSYPDHPDHGEIVAIIDDEQNFIKVMVFDKKEKSQHGNRGDWFVVTKMEVLEPNEDGTGQVSLTYNVSDEEPEEIEIMDYNYRLGIA